MVVHAVRHGAKEVLRVVLEYIRETIPASIAQNILDQDHLVYRTTTPSLYGPNAAYAVLPLMVNVAQTQFRVPVLAVSRMSALHVAALRSDVSMLHALLQAGADVRKVAATLPLQVPMAGRLLTAGALLNMKGSIASGGDMAREVVEALGYSREAPGEGQEPVVLLRQVWVEDDKYFYYSWAPTMII